MSNKRRRNMVLVTTSSASSTNTDGCGSSEVSWLRCEDEVFAVDGSVDALALLAEVEAPVVVEVAGGDEGAELEDGLSAVEAPSRSCDVHSVLDDACRPATRSPPGPT